MDEIWTLNKTPRKGKPYRKGLLWPETGLSSSGLGRMASQSPRPRRTLPHWWCPKNNGEPDGAQLHHSVPIKSSFLDECLCQAGPDASETCNYSWLPTPTASAPVPASSRHQLAMSCLLPLKRWGGGGRSLKIQAYATHFLQNAKTKQKI